MPKTRLHGSPETMNCHAESQSKQLEQEKMRITELELSCKDKEVQQSSGPSCTMKTFNHLQHIEYVYMLLSLKGTPPGLYLPSWASSVCG